MSKLLQNTVLAAAFAGASLFAMSAALAAPGDQYVPLPTYRVGPYASSGTLWWAGELDYFKYINEVEGGVDGVKLDYQEFETGWSPDVTVEVYERTKNGRKGEPVAFFFTHGTPATYALIEKAAADKMPLIDPAGGRTESTDGRVFPYAFPLLFNYYSQASVGINFIAQKEGGFDKLKGKKIVTVFLESAYGRETQAAVALLAKKYGFQDIQIAVAADSGNEQSAIWRQVREIKPDWVFLRTWGVSTPVGIKTAVRFGIPANKIIGDVWAGSEADVIPAGNAAKGYQALALYPGGANFAIDDQLRKDILDPGKSDLKNPKFFGSVYYNIGLVNAVLAVEALRVGHAKFGNRELTGDEGRWAFEHLTIDNERLKKIGFLGLLQPISLSVTDHEGGGAARIQQWDGTKWVLTTGWIQADRTTLRPLIEEKAASYAKEHNITPRDATDNAVSG